MLNEGSVSEQLRVWLSPEHTRQVPLLPKPLLLLHNGTNTIITDTSRLETGQGRPSVTWRSISQGRERQRECFCAGEVWQERSFVSAQQESPILWAHALIPRYTPQTVTLLSRSTGFFMHCVQIHTHTHTHLWSFLCFLVWAAHLLLGKVCVCFVNSWRVDVFLIVCGLLCACDASSCAHVRYINLGSRRTGRETVAWDFFKLTDMIFHVCMDEPWYSLTDQTLEYHQNTSSQARVIHIPENCLKSTVSAIWRLKIDELSNSSGRN